MSAHTIRDVREQFRAQGKFHTPPELAAFLRSLIPGVPRDVYDPTCGAGSLLAAFPDDVEKFGQDIDADAVLDAMEIPGMHTVVGDVLTDPASVDRRFHAIVANPPFSIRWDPDPGDPRFAALPVVPTAGRADMAFLAHILWMLAEDGTAAVLQFPGVLYRGGREQQIRRWMVEDRNVVDQVIRIPGGTFVDTAIATACLVLRKDRRPDAPVLFVDREHGIERAVAREEIAGQDWDLSVHRYVQPEPEPAPSVDPLALELTGVEATCDLVRSSLRMDRMVCDLQGWDYGPIWRRVRAAVDAERPRAVPSREVSGQQGFDFEELVS